MGNLCGKARISHMNTVGCAEGSLGETFRGGSETLSHMGINSLAYRKFNILNYCLYDINIS